MARSFTLWIFVWLASALTLGQAASARVAVSFDVSRSAACRDISDDEFLRNHPAERLVQIEVEISAFVNGDVDQLAETVYSLDAPERRIVVHDYLPKTSLVTDVVGNIEVQRSVDRGMNGQLSVSGDIGKLAGGNASLGGNRSRKASFRYEQLPPREMLSAAGTVGRGSGVYFKLKPTAQSSLEGARKFIVMLRVPHSWRADYLRASCHATLKDGRRVGGSSYIVPLFRAGDTMARELAHRLSDDELGLLSAAHQNKSVIRRASYPSMAHELTLRQPSIPGDWLGQIVTASALAEPAPFESRLPVAVRSAIVQYRNSKLALQLLMKTDRSIASSRIPDEQVEVRLKPIQPVRVMLPQGEAPVAFTGAGWKPRSSE